MLLYMPLAVRMWTFCSQQIALTRTTSDRTKASVNCQPSAGAFIALPYPAMPRSALATEQDDRLAGAVALVVRAAARHGEGLAGREGLAPAVAVERDGALQ